MSIRYNQALINAEFIKQGYSFQETAKITLCTGIIIYFIKIQNVNQILLIPFIASLLFSFIASYAMIKNNIPNKDYLKKWVGNLLKQFQKEDGTYPNLGNDLPDLETIFSSNWDLNNLTDRQVKKIILALKKIDESLLLNQFPTVDADNFADFVDAIEDILEKKEESYPLKIIRFNKKKSPKINYFLHSLLFSNISFLAGLVLLITISYQGSIDNNIDNQVSLNCKFTAPHFKKVNSINGDIKNNKFKVTFDNEKDIEKSQAKQYNKKSENR